MAVTDKTIPELGAAVSPLQLTDQSIVSRGNVDYNYTLQQLISFVQAGLTVGSVLTFGTITVPANTFGANGDVYVNTNDQKFYQRVAGVWVLQYAVNVTGIGNKTLFGAGVPNNATGNINDTYVNTTTGVFYNKNNAGVWVQVFSMATGPAGSDGIDGQAGPSGTNGNTVLTGITPPSNDIGVNGDYYINKNTFLIYGPKTGGVWGAGTSLIDHNSEPIDYLIAAGTPTPYMYVYDMSVGDKPKAEIALINGDGSETIDNNVTITRSGNNFIIAGVPDSSGNFINSYNFRLYPAGNIDNSPDAPPITGGRPTCTTNATSAFLTKAQLTTGYPDSLPLDKVICPILGVYYELTDAGDWYNRPLGILTT